MPSFPAFFVPCVLPLSPKEPTRYKTVAVASRAAFRKDTAKCPKCRGKEAAGRRAMRGSTKDKQTQAFEDPTIPLSINSPLDQNQRRCPPAPTPEPSPTPLLQRSSVGALERLRSSEIHGVATQELLSRVEECEPPRRIRQQRTNCYTTSRALRIETYRGLVYGTATDHVAAVPTASKKITSHQRPEETPSTWPRFEMVDWTSASPSKPTWTMTL